MSPRDWLFRIQDIIDAIERVSEHTDGLEEGSFAADKTALDAVLYCLAVIGEATRHIPETVQTSNPKIPWSDMQGMRNIVVHEYFGVSLPIIWHTARFDLPDLRSRLQALIENTSDE